MSRVHAILTITLLAGAALAGCTTGEEGDTGATTTTTTTTTSTPPTQTTTTTPPTTLPTPNVTTSLARVVVLSAPDRMAAAGDADVCARVEGTGKVPHVAIHWDTESHPNASSFTDYKGGATYPGGASAPDPLGYQLPGVFCFKVPVGANDVHFRAHALAPPNLPGTLSIEHAIRAGAATGIRLTTEVVEVASAATNVTVCWQATVAGTFGHTALHWDTVSHPNATAFNEYKGGAIYPNNTASAGTYDGPGPYCANVTMPATGAIYFRAHELVPGSVNNISAEEAIVVGSAVSVTHAARSATRGDLTLVCWRVEGAGTVPHTAIHFDSVSHPNATSFTEYKGGASYPGNGTSAAPGGYALPGPFCTSLEQTEEGLHFRAHALVPGGVRNEISDEWHIAQAG